MKYFNQLSNIEEQIIRLDTIESLIRSATSEDIHYNDVQKIVWHVSDLLQETNKELTEKFYKLWDDVRNDENQQQNLFEGFVEKDYSYKELDDVVKAWAYSSEK